jgi:hypothetical protein
MSRIQLGADFAGKGFLPGQGLHNALIAAQLFDRPAGSMLLPAAPEYQVAAADVDKDGDEDTTAVRYLPLTGEEGKTIAANNSGTIEFEPLRWCKILNFVVEPGLAAKLILTRWEIGQDNMFPSRGAIPLTTFAADATDKAVDIPWCGPGVPLVLTLKNLDTDPVVFYGSARVVAIIG